MARKTSRLQKKGHTYDSGIRMARIVLMLFTYNRPLSLRYLADGFGVHYKVVERYIRFLRENLIKDGECIFKELRGKEGRMIVLKSEGYRISASSYQIASLYLGRKILGFLKGTQIQEGLEDISDSIESGLSFVQKETLKEYERKFIAINIGEKNYCEHEGLLSDILKSLVLETRLEFAYHLKVHKVKPYTLMLYKSGLYLIGYTNTYKEIRLFAIERISNLQRLPNDKFRYPKGYSPEDIIGNAFGIQSGKEYEVVLSFNKQIAPFIKSRKWHKTESYEKVDDRLILKMECPITPELKQWILSCGSSVLVLKPKKLKDFIKNEAIAILKGS